MRKDDSFLLDILLEVPSDVRLAPKFHSCEHTHLLDDIDGLLAAILEVLFGQLLHWDVGDIGRLVDEFVFIEVFDKELRSQCTPS